MSDISRSFVKQESQLPAFYFESGAVSIGNNKSMASLVNASGSGKIVCIRSINLINAQTSAVTGTTITFGLRRITGHTGGTAVTSVTADSQDSLPSQITGATGSTVSGEGSQRLMSWIKSSDDWGSGTLDVEAMSSIIENHIPVYECKPEEKPITLRENEGITLKCETNSTAGQFTIMIRYTVENG